MRTFGGRVCFRGYGRRAPLYFCSVGDRIIDRRTTNDCDPSVSRTKWKFHIVNSQFVCTAVVKRAANVIRRIVIAFSANVTCTHENNNDNLPNYVRVIDIYDIPIRFCYVYDLISKRLGSVKYACTDQYLINSLLILLSKAKLTCRHLSRTIAE